MPTATDTLPIVDNPQGAWMAYCPTCGRTFDISEAGYQRVNAYSYGLRRSLTCPKCQASNRVTIRHVGRNGIPDQPFGYVLRKALKLQAQVWGAFLLVGIVVRFAVLLLIELL